MSTATLDIINEIKALGPRERAEIARFTRQFDEEETALAEAKSGLLRSTEQTMQFWNEMFNDEFSR